MAARLFSAIVPPAELIEELDAFLEPRREAERRLRWSRSETWHLTTAFMPDVGDRYLEALAEALEQVASRTPAFGVELAYGGAFPMPPAAKVLWLGVTEPSVEPFTKLAERTRNAAVRSGVRVDGARIRPHLTLARSGTPVDATRLVQVLDTFEGPGWTADELLLIESHLHDRARRYEVLERFPLDTGERERRWWAKGQSR